MKISTPDYRMYPVCRPVPDETVDSVRFEMVIAVPGESWRLQAVEYLLGLAEHHYPVEQILYRVLRSSTFQEAVCDINQARKIAPVVVQVHPDSRLGEVLRKWYLTDTEVEVIFSVDYRVEEGRAAAFVYDRRGVLVACHEFQI